MSEPPRPWTEILDFWFAPGMRERWFVKDSSFDDQVRRRLAPHLERALAGDYAAWMAEPRGCLALCLLLDQVPRNLYRDDPRAYAHDAQALSVTRHALTQGFESALSQVERLFLYLPLEHAEDLALQDECVARVRALDEDPQWHDYALRHREIVARFGRFPHRNAVLQRPSSAEELAFLEEEGSSF